MKYRYRGRLLTIADCNCYHPADTGSPDHAPDCALILGADEAERFVDDEPADNEQEVRS